MSLAEEFDAIIRAAVPPVTPDRTAAAGWYAEGARHLEVWSGDSGSLRKGFEAFLNSHRSDPVFAPAFAGLSRALLCAAYRWEDEYEKAAAERALRVAERGSGFDPADYDCIFARGCASSALGDLRAVLELGDYLVRANPYRIEGHLLLADGFSIQREFDKAKTYVEYAGKLTKDTPQALRAHRAKVAYEFRRGKLTWAEVEIEEALKRFPEDPVLLHDYAVTLAKGYSAKKAIIQAEKASDLTDNEHTEHVLEDLRRKLPEKED